MHVSRRVDEQFSGSNEIPRHTFALVARLLPANERHAVRVLYTFCCVVDDLADELPPEVAVPALDHWLDWLDALASGGAFP